MNWHFSDDRPIYTQLVEGIERLVVTGRYPPGSKLPGVREMAGEAGVNPNTMQRALTELEARGLLYSQRTSGRFVTEDTQHITSLRNNLATSLVKQFLRDMQALGCTLAEVEGYLQKAKEEL